MVPTIGNPGEGFWEDLSGESCHQSHPKIDGLKMLLFCHCFRLFIFIYVVISSWASNFRCGPVVALTRSPRTFLNFCAAVRQIAFFWVLGRVKGDCLQLTKFSIWLCKMWKVLFQFCFGWLCMKHHDAILMLEQTSVFLLYMFLWCEKHSTKQLKSLLFVACHNRRRARTEMGCFMWIEMVNPVVLDLFLWI